MSDRLNPDRHATPLSFFFATNFSEIKWLGLSALFYSIATASLLFATYILGNIIDSLDSGSHVRELVYMGLLLVAYEIGFRGGHILEIISLARVRASIKRSLFNHTSSLSFGYFADRFAGEIAHKIATVANAMERLVLLVNNGFIEEGVLFIATIIALSTVHPYLAWFVSAWCVLFLIGIIPFGRRSNARAGEYAQSEAKTTGIFVDLYTNIAAVKVYGVGHNRERAHRQIVAEARAYCRLGFWAILTYHYIGLSIIVLGVGFIVVTSHLYANSLISVGDVVFVSAAALRFLLNVWDVGKAVPEFIRNRGEAAQNLADLVVAPDILDGEHVMQRSKRSVDIECRNVTFGYTDERPILNDFSISVRPGDKVGIVGLSGAGKTTFANLLLRFFDPQKGGIFLNDADIRNFSQEFIRSHISYISQDTSLFHASIAENIAYGSAVASQADIEKAAHLAYADEFIKTLPRGYESIVGERGIKLSGGQRQRIAVARAILADRPLFLLDEATSALDSDSEQKIQRGLAVLMEGKTVIAIAHRLSTLSHMDRIIFLENGKIIEDGTHEQLLEIKGKYATLWHMQAGGFLPADI